LKQVNDFAAALSVAEELVASHPASPSFRNHRAEAYEHLKNFPRALDDYVNVVQLLGDPASVAGTPFYKISLMYAAMGQYCRAITPIETYVSFDPINRRSTQASKLIAEYAEKGNCFDTHSKGTARVKIVKSGGVHTLSVAINGITGRFILDTGAAYVAVTPDFAKKAGIADEGTSLSLKTVGGVVDARLNHGNTIVVGTAEARSVPVAVLRGDADPFGSRLDGLLGMSFLARFKLTLSQGGLELAAIPLR
jgi:aspartyl protease family protein